MYKKYADETETNKDGSTKTIVVQAICRKSDNAYIPFDEANSDYPVSYTHLTLPTTPYV